jgi:hypothetical protein
MLNILLAPENWLFSSALCLMLMIGMVEAIGLGGLASDAGGVDADHPLLGWLSIGSLPLSVALIVLLGTFGLTGLTVQQVAVSWTGAPLPTLLAVPAALLTAIPAARLLGGALAKVLPSDETSAVSLDSLVGRRGRIVLGTASCDLPARARVRDAFGHSHYVLVAPHVAGESLREGEEILLIGRAAGGFLAIAVTPHLNLSDGEAA